MHMLSKRDLRSDEIDTLRRSRNPITVLTTTGAVQIYERSADEVSGGSSKVRNMTRGRR